MKNVDDMKNIYNNDVDNDIEDIYKLINCLDKEEQIFNKTKMLIKEYKKINLNSEKNDSKLDIK